MKLLNNILHIEFSELISAGIPDGTVRCAKRDNSSGWVFVTDSNDQRRVLVQYEPLKEKYKSLIQSKFGNPYQYLSTHIITAHLISAQEDVDFIRSYILENGEHLPATHQDIYIEACKYLSLIARTSVHNVKEIGLDNMVTFNDAIITQIKSNNIKLPRVYTKLREKVRDYKSAGAQCVISKKWGNSNRNLLDEPQLAFIRQLRGKANQLNSVQIADVYNKTAIEKQWPTVTPQAIFWHVTKPEVKQQLIGLREGYSEYRNANDFIIGRSRPSRPGMLWVGDGTVYELYFQSEAKNDKGHRVVKYWERKYVYVVIDAYNDAVMGLAIGDKENSELARLAWKNACINSGILPDQVKTDRFASKELKEFYQNISLNSDFYTPSKAGNARDKVIEPWFGNHFKTVTRLENNFAGHGIKSNTQPNTDFLKTIKHSIPDEAGVCQQILNCMEKWNSTPRLKYGKRKLDGQSLIEDWRNGDMSKVRQLTDEMRLMYFGEVHTHKNRLTNRGLQVTLGGITRTYMLFENDFADTIGKQYQVKFDPSDLSKIMVTADEGRLRFVVSEYQTVPMAFGDFKAGDRLRLNTILSFKNRREELIKNRNDSDFEMIDAEGLTKAHFMIPGTQKHLLNAAEDNLKQLEGEVYAPSLGGPTIAIKERDIYDED